MLITDSIRNIFLSSWWRHIYEPYLWVIFESEPLKIFWLEFCLVNGSPWAFRSYKINDITWPLHDLWRHHESIRERSYDLIWTNENALKQDEKYCHLHTFERRSAIFVNLPSNGNGDRASKFWRFGFNFENGFHNQSKSFRMIHDFHAVLKLIFLTASNWFELVWTDCVKLHESKWMRLNVHEFSWISGNPDFLISGLNPWILGFLGFTHFRLEQH